MRGGRGGATPGQNPKSALPRLSAPVSERVKGPNHQPAASAEDMNEHTADCWLHSQGAVRGPRRGGAGGESVRAVEEKSSVFPHCGAFFLGGGPTRPPLFSCQQRCSFLSLLS